MFAMNNYNPNNTWEDRESHRMRRNGHYSTQDFENENALRYNRGREGDQDLRYREYSPRMYREDFGRDVNYGERYGFSGYGRSRYDPNINRGWQEDPNVQSWRETQPFTNREQDYRGDRLRRATHGYERTEPMEFRESGSSYERYVPSATEQLDGRPYREGMSSSRDFGRGSYTGIGPKNYRRTDSRIEEDVCERLMEHPEIDASNIEVKVKDGEVTLSGTVNDRNTKRMTEDVLDSIPGVRDVSNQIRIGKSTGESTSRELSGSSQRANGHAQEKRMNV